ncbi:MAG: POT family proton-dependent oligopeptide transporter [Alphaproteobacteria bacterium]
MTQKEIFSHPVGLFVLAATELWERLSYYGLRGILVLYLVHTATIDAMGWGDLSNNMLNNNALNILGWYMMAAYITPIFGGWLADNYLGERNCIFIGGLMMAIGKFIMAIPFIWVGDMAQSILWLGLGVLALGNGLFKPNISSLLGKLYEKNDVRRDAAFTLFYMGINVGAFLGFVVIGWVAAYYNYHTAFIIAGVGMVIGTLIQSIFGKSTLGDLGNEPQNKIVQADKANKNNLSISEKMNVGAIIIISIFAMLFFSIYEQIAGSFMLFTQNNTDLVIGGFSIPPAWVLSVNPAFIIIFAPFTSILLAKNFMKKIDITHKYAFGYGVLCFAFVIASLAALPIDEDPTYKVNIIWPCITFILITIAELCISPVGLSTISNLSPTRLAGLMMGVFFFFLGIGNKLSTELGKFIVGNGQGYSTGFMTTALICLVIGLVIMIFRRYFQALIHATD